MTESVTHVGGAFRPKALLLFFLRMEASKLQLSSRARVEQPPGGRRRTGQRCCQDSQHGRCSPTGRAVTTPDRSKTAFFNLCFAW